MRILITGSRHWHDPDMAESVVARLVARYGPVIVESRREGEAGTASLATCLATGYRLVQCSGESDGFTPHDGVDAA